MAKKVVRIAKLEFNAGQAKPGPELAGLGIVMPEFTKQFNDATKDRGNEPVPVEITIHDDKSFIFKLFTAPATYKLMQAANIKKGSANSKTTKVATITKKQLEEIASYKLVDLNTDDLEAGMRIIAGTAKNMGILIEGFDNIDEANKQAKEAQLQKIKQEANEAKLQEEIKTNAEMKDAKIEVEVIKEKSSENGDK
ncbi:MAG: 50S ribosomal protein L11 [Metamycoplasmataceae bacterium]